MVNHPSDLGFCTQLRMGWTLLPKLLFSNAPSIYLPLSLPGERERESPFPDPREIQGVVITWYGD